jgi:hypothetical protein
MLFSNKPTNQSAGARWMDKQNGILFIKRVSAQTTWSILSFRIDTLLFYGQSNYHQRGKQIKFFSVHEGDVFVEPAQFFIHLHWKKYCW